MKNDLVALNELIKRNLRIFLSDKSAVFFSLLAPIIILFLYVMFLGDLQLDSIKSGLEGMPIDEKVMHALVDGWMLAGVMAVSCITVSYSAQTVMINDRENGVVSDMLASPIKRGVLSVSYLVYNFIVTLIICAIVLCIAFIYLAISGWYLSVSDAFAAIGLTLVSVLSASLFSTLVCMNIKTQSAHGASAGIMSAAIGFLIGAYMPLSMFPKAIQYIVLIMPGTYSAGVYRNLFMNGALDKIAEVSQVAADEIAKDFSMQLNFFGKYIDTDIMWGIFAATIVLFIAIYAVVQIVKAKRNTLFTVEHKLFKKKPKANK